MASEYHEASTKSTDESLKHARESYINKLPAERIAEILSYTVMLHYLPRQSPSNLALVCRKWFEVTRDFCELWCHIYLEIPLSVGSLQHHLYRSGNMPLSVYVMGNLRKSSLVSEFMSRRWKSLRVVGNQASEVLGLLREQNRPLQFLTSLDIDFPILHDGHSLLMKQRARDLQESVLTKRITSEPTFIDLFPNLHHLKLFFKIAQAGTSPKAFVQTSLSTLDITFSECDIFAVNIWEILASTPLLKTLRITCLGYTSGHWIGRRSFEKHANLSNIYMKGDTKLIRTLLPVIDCASDNLVTLELDQLSFLEWDPATSLLLPEMPNLAHLILQAPIALFFDSMKFSGVLSGLQSLSVVHSNKESGSGLTINGLGLVPESFLRRALECAREQTTPPMLRTVKLDSVIISEVDSLFLRDLSQQYTNGLALVLKNCTFETETDLSELEGEYGSDLIII